ncbi:hydrogen peroxide-dependent heme synthase [Microlunatus soli]|uniref:Coproheme decarboxylase n=1 Tax=Microlunatus soli TaxID=630515 RepID=A0A1H2ARB9_9ACTN|nr:chlorite dismutase [Microlunatus soli]
MAKAREINDTIRYTMWSVFRLAVRPDGAADELAGSALADIEKAVDGEDLAIRGWYDVAALRADADLMVWWHAPDIEVLQEAYHALRRSQLGSGLESVWSQAALHRPAEFNKGHVPAFMSGEEPKDYACVYPFVRSYEWYLLPDQERRTMLAEHGMMARPYPDVRANTVASFALGDYEWMLAFEADELHRIVDLMRELRKAPARRHTREEIPFFTGRRRELADIVSRW